MHPLQSFEAINVSLRYLGTSRLWQGDWGASCASWEVSERQTPQPLLLPRAPSWAVCALQSSLPCQCRIIPRTNTHWMDTRAVRFHSKHPSTSSQPAIHFSSTRMWPSFLSWESSPTRVSPHAGLQCRLCSAGLNCSSSTFTWLAWNTELLLLQWFSNSKKHLQLLFTTSFSETLLSLGLLHSNFFIFLLQTCPGLSFLTGCCFYIFGVNFFYLNVTFG